MILTIKNQKQKGSDLLTNEWELENLKKLKASVSFYAISCAIYFIMA